MLLSKTCVYGLQAAVVLADKNRDEFTTIRDLSDDLEISFHFLTKVLQRLTKSGILQSYKGPNGGVRLAQSPSSVAFMDIVLSIDGDDIIHDCAMGLPGCGVMKPCPLHDQWSELKDDMLQMMRSTTLQELVSDSSGPLHRMIQ